MLAFQLIALFYGIRIEQIESFGVNTIVDDTKIIFTQERVCHFLPNPLRYRYNGQQISGHGSKRRFLVCIILMRTVKP